MRLSAAESNNRESCILEMTASADLQKDKSFCLFVSSYYSTVNSNNTNILGIKVSRANHVLNYTVVRTFSRRGFNWPKNGNTIRQQG